MINTIAKSIKITCWEKKLQFGGIIVLIKAPVNGDTDRVLTFERQIKTASNLVKVSTMS